MEYLTQKLKVIIKDSKFNYQAESEEEFFSNDTISLIETSEKIFVTYNLFRLIMEEFSMKRRWSKMYALISAILHQWTDRNPAAFFLRNEGNLFPGIEGLVQLFINSASKCVITKPSEIIDSGWDSYVQQQSTKFKAESLEEVFKNINSSANDWVSLLTSEFGRKLNTAISLLVCVPVVNNCGITPSFLGYEEKVERAMRFEYEKYSKLNLVTILIEHTTWVALKMCTLYSITKLNGIEAGIRSLFVSNQDFQEFEAEYMWLKRNHENFSCRSLVLSPDGKPDPFTLEGYMHRCERALNLATKVMPALKHDPAAKNRMERSRYDILSYQSKCAAELRAGESRPFPYAIMLCGPPGIGKSAIKDNCFIQMHMSDNATGRFEIKYNPSLVYTANPSDDFYSGFSTEHTSILLDDVAQKTADIIKANAGDDLSDLIQIINKIPFLPNQAELEKKGKTPMRVRYVIGTTNTPDLSAAHVYKCTEAIYRRMVFVEAEVKPEYRLNNSVALHGDEKDPSNLNLWNFKIYRYFPTGGNNPTRRYWNGNNYVNSTSPAVFDLENLMKFIDTDINTHWSKEERANVAYETVIKAHMCEHGISSAICSHCRYKGESLDYIRGVYPYYRQQFLEKFKSCYTNIFLILPIYTLLFVGMFYTWFFNKTTESVPVKPYRMMRSLIDKIPHDVSMPNSLRLFNVIPDDIKNYTLYQTGSCVKSYMTEVYLARVYKRLTWSDYYQKDVSRMWLIPGFLGFLCALRYMRRLSTIQYGESSEIKYPVRDPEEKAKNNYWLQQRHLGIFPNAGSTIATYDLTNQCILNTIAMDFECSDRYIHTNGFILKGNLVVTVSHCINFDDMPTSVKLSQTTKAGYVVTVSCKIDKTILYVDAKNDLMFFRFDRLPLGRDMTKYLISNKEKVHINCPGKMLHFRNKDDLTMTENNIHRVENITPCTPYHHKNRYYDVTTCLNATTDIPTMAGHCGAPIIALQGTQRMIVGIHCASNGRGSSLVRAIYLEDVLNAEQHLNSSPISDNDKDLFFTAESKAQEIIEVHPSCPTHKLKEHEIIVIGGNTLPRSKPRTRVDRSPIAMKVLDFYRNFGYKRIEHVSPIHCSPKTAVLLSMEQAVHNAQFFPSEISYMVSEMSKEFLTKFSPDMLKRLHPYPMAAAINGVDGIPYVDRLNLLTSGGYSHSGPKKKLFDLVNSDEYHAVKYDLTPELQQEVDWILEQYRNGKEANPVFKCSFKDEPITIEKADRSKVRIFSASPTAFSIVTRMYLLCIIREFVGHRRLSFEMAIGANAHGMDWEEIYNHVIKHGEDRCFAGDYKNFDKQMAPELILAAFEVIINILKAAEWSDDDLKIIRGIAHDTAHPTMDLFGTLVKCYGSNPSGHVLTTPINSLVNSLYIRIATKRILDKHKVYPDYSRFSDIVSMVTYGDDNCGSISNKYPQITHTSIQNALAEAGIVYTTDDKKSLSVGLTDVSKITFLKRHFVYDEDLKRVVAPLLDESLFKALTVWTYSPNIAAEEQLAAVVDSVNREYFFHGKQKFEQMHSFLCSIMIDKHLSEYLPNGKLSSWDDLYHSLHL